MPSIYKITNLITNKIYIGQTVNDIDHRFRHHKAQVNCKNVCSALYSAFKKYGKDNFTIEPIVNGDYTKNELNELEIFYIKKFNSLSPNGYNLQHGGNSNLIVDSVKKQISDKLKGRDIKWKEKVAVSVKKLWENEEYRKRQTLQRHNKRGKYRKGIIRDKLRVKINLQEFTIDYLNYMTVKNICSKYNISAPTIYRIIKEKNIKKRGYKCNKKE